MRLSVAGVTNVAAWLSPGMSGPIVAASGKHVTGGHPAGSLGYSEVTSTHTSSKPCGRVPAFVSVSVTVESFCVFSTLFEKPSSSTVKSMV